MSQSAQKLTAAKPPVDVDVDQLQDIPAMIDQIVDHTLHDPTALHLFLDAEPSPYLEGGPVWLQIMLRPTNTIYLIDVLTLGSSTFTTSNKAGVTLQDIIETPSIRKAFWRARGDCNNLYTGYGIKPLGIDCLAVLTLLVMKKKDMDVDSGLADFVNARLKTWMPKAEIQWFIKQKKETKDLFRVEAMKAKADSTFVPTFNRRPVEECIKGYCRWDVRVLPTCYYKQCEAVAELKAPFTRLYDEDFCAERPARWAEFEVKKREFEGCETWMNLYARKIRQIEQTLQKGSREMVSKANGCAGVEGAGLLRARLKIYL